MTAPIERYVARARGVGRSRDIARTPMERIVIRATRADVDRVDALRTRFPDASRASLIRAFIAYGLAIAEALPLEPSGGAT